MILEWFSVSILAQAILAQASRWGFRHCLLAWLAMVGVNHGLREADATMGADGAVVIIDDSSDDMSDLD